MMLGMPNATQLFYGLRVMPAVPQPAANANAPRAGKNAELAGPTTRYVVDFMIRWTDVKLAVAADGRCTGKIQVELEAYDRDGKALNWEGGTQMMNLPQDVYDAVMHSGIPAHFEIDLPVSQEAILVTGVYDWGTGKAGTLEIPLDPEFAEKMMAVEAGCGSSVRIVRRRVPGRRGAPCPSPGDLGHPFVVPGTCRPRPVPPARGLVRYVVKDRKIRTALAVQFML
jgi:hypothetical protein